MAGRKSAEDIEIKVVNMLKVNDEKQIMLEVRLAEVVRSLSDDTGVDWRYMGDLFGNTSDISFLDGGTPAYHGGDDGWSFPSTNGGQGTSVGEFSWDKGNRGLTYGLDYLVSKGLAKIIAKPNLLVRNGEEASFLAGGEFPVPIQEEDAVRIEWKEFGVKLTFTPLLDERDNINLVLAPEVSVLDFSDAAVSVNGFDIPALKTRRTETKVVLKEGQSYYVSGLISQTETDTLAETPGISNIPILGELFKKKDETFQETELIVFVTPRIVNPIRKTVNKRFDDPEKMKLLTNTAPIPFEQAHADEMKKFIEQGEKPTASLEDIRQAAIDAEMKKIILDKEQKKLSLANIAEKEKEAKKAKKLEAKKAKKAKKDIMQKSKKPLESKQDDITKALWQEEQLEDAMKQSESKRTVGTIEVIELKEPVVSIKYVEPEESVESKMLEEQEKIIESIRLSDQEKKAVEKTRTTFVPLEREQAPA